MTRKIVNLGTTNSTPGVSIPRGVPEQKEILTLTVTAKASFHSPLVNAVFAHCLNSGVGVHGSKVERGLGASFCWAVFKAASPSRSGEERHRCVKSDAKA